MRARPIRLLAALLPLLLLLSACGGQQEEGGDAVTVGAVLPLTGTGAATGDKLLAAMEVAVDIVNGSHDLDWDIAQNAGLQGLGGAELRLLTADCQSDATTASIQAASLLEQGISGIAGAYASSYSAAVAAQALEYGVPMVCGSSSSASLTDGVTYDFTGVLNRVAATDEMETVAFFEYLQYLNDTYDAGIETVAIAYVNNAYGIHANRFFLQYAEAYGFQVVAQVSYGEDITTADIEVARIIAADPDVVFHASYIDDLCLFADVYNAYGFSPSLILCYCGGFQDVSFGAVAEELGVDYYAGGQVCTASLADRLEEFNYINELYRAKTGVDLDGPALEEFASIILLAQAMDACGSDDPAQISAALRSTRFDAPYLTPGYVEFDENGQNTAKASFITQLIGGRYEVVYPIDEFTTAEPALGAGGN